MRKDEADLELCRIERWNAKWERIERIFFVGFVIMAAIQVVAGVVAVAVFYWRIMH